ncbi:hypothetical protein HMPREF9123_2883 [Neisseria bacilliformis ATCC BAA-1200]|uniref:Uncharacterized protein n=1 Tax=Neisseria bacilliformis ATCC BAA-1200 TaxID=888742 RepID=F2BGM6_9NEIS|nr:hypothetical protein HMPREF9123_2883 [Neisseria bacilliformis ATCC BAA-1200]
MVRHAFSDGLYGTSAPAFDVVSPCMANGAIVEHRPSEKNQCALRRRKQAAETRFAI